MNINFIKLRPEAQTPTFATKGSAAADLYAICPENGIRILPGKSALITTGIAVELPSAEYAAFIFARSGLAIKNGIMLANGVGVIDSDYRGEICVGLYNSSDWEYTVKNGERIAQIAIMPVILPSFIEKKSLANTERGENGFGSTGKL